MNNLNIEYTSKSTFFSRSGHKFAQLRICQCLKTGVILWSKTKGIFSLLPIFHAEKNMLKITYSNLMSFFSNISLKSTLLLENNVINLKQVSFGKEK